MVHQRMRKEEPTGIPNLTWRPAHIRRRDENNFNGIPVHIATYETRGSQCYLIKRHFLGRIDVYFSLWSGKSRFSWHRYL